MTNQNKYYHLLWNHY